MALKLEPRKDEILAMYNSGMNVNKIATTIGEYVQPVSNLLKVYAGREKWRPYRFNHNYFDVIDSEGKAYMLGFIAADGAIVQNNTGSSTLTISIH